MYRPVTGFPLGSSRNLRAISGVISRMPRTQKRKCEAVQPIASAAFSQLHPHE